MAVVSKISGREMADKWHEIVGIDRVSKLSEY